MFLQLLFAKQVILFKNLLELSLQLINCLFVFRWVPHLFSVFNELFYVFVFVFGHFFQSFDFCLELLDLSLFLFDDTLQIHHSLQCDLIGLLGFVLANCLLQSFDHFVCILELHVLGLQGDWMPIFVIILLEFVLSRLLQLLVKPNRQLFEFSPQFSVFLVEACLIRDGGWRRGRRWRFEGVLSFERTPFGALIGYKFWGFLLCFGAIAITVRHCFQLYQCIQPYIPVLLLAVILLQNNHDLYLIFSSFIIQLVTVQQYKSFRLSIKSDPMSELQFSNKPQILRLHELQTQERNKFCTDFAMTLNQLLPSALLRKIRSSEILTRIMAICPDLYYTFVTINYCRRRLGQEYTYIAMYKREHFEQQGVLINRKTRTLITILQIISRHGIVPWIQKYLQKKIGEERVQGQYLKFLGEVKRWVLRFIGSGEQIINNIQWVVLMLFMLNWTKRFTIIEKILGISYVYTYKNDQLQDISYKIEGYLILATLAIKLAKHIYTLYQEQKAQREQPKRKVFVPAEITESVAKSAGKQKVLCRICYDELRDRSATRCGHIFCWGCIIRCLQMSEECPVCRTRCLGREVVQLRNY